MTATSTVGSSTGSSSACTGTVACAATPQSVTGSIANDTGSTQIAALNDFNATRANFTYGLNNVMPSAGCGNRLNIC